MYSHLPGRHFDVKYFHPLKPLSQNKVFPSWAVSR